MGLLGRSSDKGAAAAKDGRRESVSSSQSIVANTDNLPETLDLKAVHDKRKPSDTCKLCEAPFTNNLRLLNRNPKRHCKRCAKAICEVCSETKR